MPDLPVSVIVLTKNDERKLGTCLTSVERFSEVFVVDSSSTDRTREIAGAAGATVVDFDWNGEYPKKKQWSLQHLPFSNEWALFLDADEELTPAITNEIAATIAADPAHAAYFARLETWFLGRRLRHGHQPLKLVLLRRTRATFRPHDDLDVKDPIEVELHLQPHVDGTVGALDGTILHHSRSELTLWIARHNRYSDWEALLRDRGELPDRGEAQTTSRRRLKRVFARLPFKGAAMFVHSYILRRGFLDGRAGFHYAVGLALYYWQIGAKIAERRQAGL